jgi:glutathione synthase/RimK-type ligase-like ATP-grasp enzyme
MPRVGSDRPITILTNTRDLAADDVVRRLDEVGHHVIRINADLLVHSPAPTWTLEELSAMRIGAVWWRQFEQPSTDMVDPEDIDMLLVTRAQWRAWISIFHRPGVPWINDLWAARRAENKIEQLRVAHHVGFDVPRTVITNDPAEARRFREERPAVVKSLNSGYFEFSGHAFVYTRELTPEILEHVAGWLQQPVIVQQRVIGNDVRIVVVGDECFGARCSTHTIDWRTAGRDAGWERWDVDPHLGASCRAYLKEFGLRYAAFDLIEERDRCWFLEANQAGEWAFLERELHLGITDSFVAYLTAVSGVNRRDCSPSV